MTDREKMEFITKTNSCYSFLCIECPLWPCMGNRVIRAKEWLAKNGGTMNKNAALERLDAIKKETAELQKIIEQKEDPVYDNKKMYVAIFLDRPYLLVDAAGSWGWMSFIEYPAERVWDEYDTVNEALADAIKNGELGIFDNPKSGMAYFYGRYMEQ